MLNKKTQLLIVAIVISALVGLLIYLTFPASSYALQKKLLAIVNKIPTQAGKNNFIKQSAYFTKAVDPELVDLDSQILTCSAHIDGLLSAHPTYGGSCSAAGGALSDTKNMYLSGQCCGTLMNTHDYHENLNKLQAYRNVPDVPLDPMHTPIEIAKKWIDYDSNTTLTPGERKIYDQAYAISKEKPCCCKCWHYFVNEGIAKKMIRDGKWNAEQIAAYWDASDICGA